MTETAFVKKNYQITLLKTSMFLSFSPLIYGIPGILILGENPKFEIIRFCLCSALAIATIVHLKKTEQSRIAPYALGGISIIFSICEIELIASAEIDGQPLEGRDFFLQLLMMTVYSWSLKWYVAPMIHGSLTIYKFLRLLPQNLLMGIPLIKLLTFMSLLAILNYLHEKKEKERIKEFKKLEKQNAFLNNFLNSYIPNPLIIAGLNEKEDEVIHYSNQAILKIMEGTDDTNLLSELNAIAFQPGFEKNRTTYEGVQGNKKKSPSSFSNILKEVLATSKSLEETKYIEFKAKLNACLTKNPVSLLHLENNSSNGLSNRSIIIPDEHEIPGRRILDAGKSDYIDEKFPESISLKHQRKKKRYFKIKACKIMWESLQAVFFIFEEFTESVNYSEAKAHNRMNGFKDKILATASHKLYTHLNIIIFSIENVLKFTSHLEEVYKNMKVSLHSAQLLFYSLKNLFDLTQIDRRPMEPSDPGSHQVGPLIEEVIELVKFPAKVKQIKLLTNNENCKDTYVVCDPEYLKRVLLIILENAIKFNKPEGTVMISTQIVANPDDNERSYLKNDARLIDSGYFVQFIVEDTGIGISVAKIKKLFEFYEKEKRLSFGNQGVRTGLPLSQILLISMLRPEHIKSSLIKVASVEGVGSKFSFMLPLCNAMNDQEKIREKQLIKLPHLLSFDNIKRGTSSSSILIERQKSHDALRNSELVEQIRVLIVDDDKINQLVLKNYLTKIGITKYETADDGEQAVKSVILAASQNNHFQIILMDINMPVLDGYQSSKQIVKLSEEGLIPALSIIAITANIVINDMEKCRENGMVAFLSKPVNKRLLRQEIEKITGLTLIGDEKE